MDFYIFYISQGNVATQLRYGGIFSNHFIMNFPQNAPVRKFWESVNIWQRYWQNFVVYFFGATLYILCTVALYAHEIWHASSG